MKDSVEFDFSELDIEIQEQLDNQLKELENLKIDRSSIENTENLAELVSQIVWEQFIIQIAGQAGADFIKENQDLRLSLKRADHYLNSNSFPDGKMPLHNSKNMDEYQSRYYTWKENFNNNDPNKRITRDAFDKNRPIGSASIAKDHTIPIAEILRDKEMTTYVDQTDKVAFANDPNINLKDLDSRANSSKGDRSMKDWLNSERNGKTPGERFDIEEEDLRQRDNYAREKKQELINNKKTVADRQGSESRVAEARSSIGFASQAIALALLAKLTKNIFQELIRWYGEDNRKVKTFFAHLKKSVSDFFLDTKNNLLLSVDVGATVVLSQLLGEIVSTLRRAFLFIKLGGKNVVEVAKYFRKPETKNKDTATIITDIGRIIITGLTAAGGIGLGIAITALLAKSFPILASPIPMLGSPASLLGIFFGGITAGLCGAIVLHTIEGTLANRKLRENTNAQTDVKNKILRTQNVQFSLYFCHVDDTAKKVTNNMKRNQQNAISKMRETVNSLDEERTSINKDKFIKISSMIDDLE